MQQYSGQNLSPSCLDDESKRQSEPKSELPRSFKAVYVKRIIAFQVSIQGHFSWIMYRLSFACSEALLKQCCQLAQGSRREAMLPSTASGAQILLQKLHKEMWESHASPQKRHYSFMLLQFLAGKTPNLYKDVPEETPHAGNAVAGQSNLLSELLEFTATLLEMRSIMARHLPS